MRTDASAVTGKTAMQRHVFYSLCRRAALAALFGFVASSALATGASPMEGTWGSADAQGRTAQITIVGDKVIGVFWEQAWPARRDLCLARPRRSSRRSRSEVRTSSLGMTTATQRWRATAM